MPFQFEPPTPEQLAHMKLQEELAERVMRAEAQMHLANYRRLCRWAAVMCACPVTHDTRDPSRHQTISNCPVHGTFVIINQELL